MENILHFQYTGGPPSATDCVAIAGAVNAQVASNLKSLYIPGITLESVSVLDIDSSTGKQGINTSPVVGTRTGDSNPANCAVVISHQIARRYRGGHPRTYAPFLHQGDIAGPQVWGATQVNSVTSGWNAFIAGCLTITSGSTVVATYVNVSYHSGHALRPTPLVDPITGSGAKTRIGSQRRRLGK